MDVSAELKILAADDSPIYRKLVEQSLSCDHHQVLFAKNGREALELFAKHLPALVITDWTMPDISGIELCRRIRQDFPQHHPHIILLTSNTEKDQVVEGLAAGADDYLTKPFHQGELRARVRVALRVVELYRQVQAKNIQLEELALTDPLTALPNRRAIDFWITGQLSAAARHDFGIWVALADLDHFKKVNDTYGHDSGDAVLKAFAQTDGAAAIHRERPHVLRHHQHRSSWLPRYHGSGFPRPVSRSGPRTLLRQAQGPESYRIRRGMTGNKISKCRPGPRFDPTCNTLATALRNPGRQHPSPATLLLKPGLGPGCGGISLSERGRWLPYPASHNEQNH